LDKFEPFADPFVELDLLIEIKDPDLVPEGKKELHRTKGGKGAVGQLLAKHKKLPPNCS